MSLMNEGLMLSVLGIGVVFVFLSVLVMVMTMMTAFFEKIGHLIPEPSLTEEVFQPADETEEVAAVLAAVFSGRER